MDCQFHLQSAILLMQLSVGFSLVKAPTFHAAKFEVAVISSYSKIYGALLAK